LFLLLPAAAAFEATARDVERRMERRRRMVRVDECMACLLLIYLIIEDAPQLVIDFG
jgi:hypothetical protein